MSVALFKAFSTPVHSDIDMKVTSIFSKVHAIKKKITGTLCNK